MNRRPFLAFLLALPILLAGCKINTINSFPTNPAHVRLTNTIPNATAITVTVDGGPAWANLPFEALTPYMDFSNTQQHNFTLTILGTGTTPVTSTFNLAGTASYTLLAFGTADSPALALMPDDTVAPPSGAFTLRLANVAAGAGTLDFYLVPPNQAIDNVGPNLSGVIFGSSTGFINFNGGSYRMLFTQFGTKNIVYDSGTISLAGNSTLDTIVYTRNGGLLVNVSLATVLGPQPSAIMNSKITELKIFNAAYQTGAVNAYLDSTTVPMVAGLAYPAASGYNIIPPGAHTLSFEAVTTPGAIIATAAPNLQAATDTSVLLTGLAGALQTVVLNDLNYPPTNSGNTRLRVVNASPDAPPLTLLLNTTQAFTGLAYLSASNYIETGGGTYTLTLNDASGRTLLALSNITLNAGQTNTLYLVGPAASLAGAFTQDN